MTLSDPQRAALSAEILTMVQADQEMRNGKTWDEQIDYQNTARLKQIISEYGWPRQSVFGHEVSNAAWLLAQHADHDPQFQQQCLDLITALPASEMNPRFIAYLTDRIKDNLGQPQLYGTQIFYTNDHFEDYNIENEAELDQRRANMNLGPFAQYKDYCKNEQATFDGYFELLDNSTTLLIEPPRSPK